MATTYTPEELMERMYLGEIKCRFRTRDSATEYKMWWKFTDYPAHIQKSGTSKVVVNPVSGTDTLAEDLARGVTNELIRHGII